MMKYAILLFGLIGILNPLSYADTIPSQKDRCIVMGDAFNDGWKVGWKAGWRQVNGQYSYPSFPPFPPFPNFGEDNFQGGYNAGFLAGIEAAGGLR